MIATRFGSMGLCAFLFGLVADPAQADSEVLLDYRAPEGCPDRAHFVAMVADRGGRLSGAQSTSRVDRLEVSIEPDESEGFVGTLLVTLPDGSTTPRQVHDPECAEVVTGLAVVAAIALGGGEESEPTVSAPAATPAPSAVAEPSKPAAPPASDFRLRGSSYGQPDSVAVSAGTLRFVRDRRFTLSGGIDYGLIPELPMPRFDFSIGFGEFVVTPSGSSRLVGPVLRVRWTLFTPASRTEGARTTEALGVGAGIALCSAITYDDRAFSLLACSEFDVGTMGVDTTEADGSSSTKNSGFGTAGLAFDAEYGLGELFHVGLRVGGRAQVGAIDANRRGGQQDSESSLFFGGYATVGLGLHF